MRQFEVRVKTSSKLGPLIEAEVTGDMTIHLREKSIDGNTNRAMLILIAKHLDVASNQVSIVRGHSTRVKLIRIND